MSGNIKTEKDKNVRSSNLSHFQSIYGGTFLERRRPMGRLSSYVRTNSTTDGRQVKNFFTVI